MVSSGGTTHLRAVLAAAIFLLGAGAMLALPAAAEPAAVPGRVIVKWKPQVAVGMSPKGSPVGGMGLATSRSLPHTGVSILEVTDQGKSVDQAIKELMASGLVEYAEPDYLINLDVTPNDPSFATTWGLHNTGGSGGVEDADIDAPEAWDITTGSSDVVVAVIDTGIDYGHPDLAANMWINPGEVVNGLDDDGNGYIDDIHGINALTDSGDPMDDHYHGTHVAGTIGAVADNGVGVAGVAWNVRLMGLKFLNENGSGSTSSAIECIEYAVMMKAQYGVNVVVTNNSWGGGGFSQSLSLAIQAAGDAGILFVAAAGNDGANTEDAPHYPSNYEHDVVLSVASTTRADVLSSFSNYGVESVDLAAPGSSILNTLPDNSYGSLSGTSMATPHAAGVAALVFAYDPSADPVGVKSLLMTSADPIAALQGYVLSGGRLNAANALEQCVTGTPSLLVQLADGFSAFADQERVISARLGVCTTAIPGATVSVLADDGQPAFPLADDGQAPDVSADDGVYTGSWTPDTEGAVSLTVSALSGAGPAEAVINGTVFDTPTYVFAADGSGWVDATLGTDLGLALDDGTAEVALPFAFNFYGTPRDTVLVSSNGYLAFGSDGSFYQNSPIPVAGGPIELIAPYWDDLNPSVGGAIYTLVDGAAPNRRVTVQWHEVPYWEDNGTATFQVTLYEEGGRIEFRYLDVENGSLSKQGGASATIGIQHGSGAFGLLHSYNEASVGNGDTLVIRDAFECEGMDATTTPTASPTGMAPVSATPTRSARAIPPRVKSPRSGAASAGRGRSQYRC